MLLWRPIKSFAAVFHQSYWNWKDRPLLVKAPCKRNSHKPTVVLADSNDDFRSYLTSCLTEEFTIKSFRDGIEAMAYIKNEYPDLVICDTELQNMDGVELSSRLKNILRNINHTYHSL